MKGSIILRDWQIRALKEGRLSQIRVLHDFHRMVGPPFEAGAVLRVRERWQRQWNCDACDEPGIGLAFGWPEDERCPHCRTTFIYAADGGDLGEGWDGEALSWMSPATMPREVSRFSLTVVQRPTLQQVREMTEADAVACGAKHWPDIPGMGPRWSCDVPANTDQCLATARFAFANRWFRDLGEKPHEDNAWDRNAWTWRVDVERGAR